MPIGTPDWYSAGRSENQASLTDMAELAVRLGSGVNFDRTGKVIWYDPFIRYDGLYEEANVGATATWAVDTTYAETEGSALKATLGAGTSNYISILRHFRSWRNSVLSLEVAVYCTEVPDKLLISINQYQNPDNYMARLLVNNGCQDINYLHPTKGTVDTGVDLDSPFGYPFFYVFKVDADFNNLVYKRLRVNDETIILTDEDVHRPGSATTFRGRVDLAVYGHASNAMDIHVDRLIFTEDE